MDALTILIIYLIFFGLAFIGKTLLSILNINHIQANKNNPPAFINEIMDKATYQKKKWNSVPILMGI